ncbi:phage tail assembly protein [Chromobacterium haemolyticum]|uniref:Phage tail assembly protein n=1 Tax=Chromobacterium fluminis TaxID=3044269 RepID=A0ABX0LEZ9_9NEIS|nr:phage tail assembly protein [Chromobacterium haemolyticum]NHR08006.1 phage tail assembly protein [Chromobacterium haemolyticum]
MAVKEYQLSASIEAHGETLMVLSLSQPTNRQVQEIGMLPYRVSDDGTPQPLPQWCARYIAKSASIPPSSVDQIALHDFNELCWAMVGFFMKPESKP